MLFSPCDIIITAHTESKRLPKKVLLPILGKPILWHVINRAKRAKYVDRVIVSIPITQEGDVLEEIAANAGAEVFRINDIRNNRKDLLNSVLMCSNRYHVKHIIRITADCPLIDPDIIDVVAEAYWNSKCEFASNWISGYTWPEGTDVEIISYELLEFIAEKALLDSEREHITRYIHKNPIPKLAIRSRKPYKIFKGSVDNLNDYLFVKSIFEGIGKNIFSIDDAEEYIESHPETLEINSNSIINEGAIKLDRDEGNKKPNTIILDY